MKLVARFSDDTSKEITSYLYNKGMLVTLGSQNFDITFRLSGVFYTIQIPITVIDRSVSYITAECVHTEQEYYPANFDFENRHFVVYAYFDQYDGESDQRRRIDDFTFEIGTIDSQYRTTITFSYQVGETTLGYRHASRIPIIQLRS